MYKKLCYLTPVVLLLVLCSSTQAAVPERALDVNNFSFELNEDGTQACGHTGDLGLAWDIGNNRWIGQDVNCASPIFCMDCEPFAEGCNCKAWPASEGHIMAYIQTNDIYFKQILEDEVILANHQYKMTMDSMSWDPEVRFTASVYYEDGGEDIDAASKEIVLEMMDDPNTAEWTEYSVVVVAPPGHPGIGKPLGIKWFCHTDFDDWRWAFLDNIRVTDKLATDAWNPNPEDMAINVPLDSTQLSWSPGLWADTHNVYFSTNFDDVNNLELSSQIATEIDVNTTTVPITLQLGGEYFWLVEEINDSYTQIDPCDLNFPPDSPWPGPVWSFKTNDGKAFAFSPGDEEEDVLVDVVLQWIPGVVAASHDLYFSTSFDDVNSRQESVRINLGPNSWNPPGELDLGETYYWAVDEVNEAVLGSPWQSTVLSFTVIGYRTVDDMETYDTSTNPIEETWVDWYENDSTAEILREIGDANYIRDEQSMKFVFENSDSPYYAETSREFSPAQDWTEARLETLVLYLRADMTNGADAVQPMSVFISDGVYTGTVQYDDPNDLIRGWTGWQEWNIELQEFVDNESLLDLTSIASMGIVIGTEDVPGGGDGYVYIDDIRLYPPRCVINQATGSFNNDCGVDIYDLEVLARDWLISGIGAVTASEPNDTGLFGHWTMDDNVSTGPDASKVTDLSGNNNHGILYDSVTPQGEPDTGATSNHSVAGVISTALEFDGFDDYVEVPPMNSSSNTITISAWVKRESFVNIYAGIVMSSNAYDPCDIYPEPGYTAGLQLGSDTDTWQPNYEMSFMWTGYSWEWHPELFVPPQQWTFTALAVAPDVATLYLYDGISLQAARNYDTHEALPWNTPFHIADQMQFGPGSERFFAGAIDDVRIYNRTLSPQEIASLAGLSSAEIGLEPWRANANDDDMVDLADYAIMADNWLTEILWP